MNYSELQDKYFCQSTKPTAKSIESLISLITSYSRNAEKISIHIKGDVATVAFGDRYNVENHPCFTFCSYSLACRNAKIYEGKRLPCIYFDRNFVNTKIHDSIP